MPSFGEVNENNEPQGRGISMYEDNDDIWIGYFEDDDVTGNYIRILSDGWFNVGEIYYKDGDECGRGTWYNPDGREEKYDY